MMPMEKSSGKPVVSVIIPTHNSAAVLPDCLKSIREQSGPHCEIIVVDDFSSDDTVEIAEAFRANVVQQRCNPALARNIGITHSHGTYLLFQDSDQILSKLVIEDCVGKCEDDQAGMVRIPEVFVGRTFWSSCSALWKNYYQVVERTYRNKTNILSGEPRFFAKEHVLHVGMLDSTLVWGEDYDLYLRLKRANVKETCSSSCIYHCETDTLRGFVVKNIRYAKSMPAFTRQTRKRVLPSMFIHALLTLRGILKSSHVDLKAVAGCILLLYVKACCVSVGIIAASTGDVKLGK